MKNFITYFIESAINGELNLPEYKHLDEYKNFNSLDI